MENNTENIIQRMKDQHAGILETIRAILNLTKNADNINTDEVFKGLDVFKKRLAEHLELENNVFYVELIKRMEAAGDDTEEAKTFINGMKNIETGLNAFLERFAADEDLKLRPTNFTDELISIKNQLKIRVDAEEGGIYTYWDKYNA